MDRLHRRAFARAFVLAHGDLLGDQAQRLVGHTGRHGDGGDFGIEQASGLGCASLLLAGGAVFVHGFTANVVALGHLLGGLQHAPVDLGLLLGQGQVLDHVQVHLLLHAGDALNATSHKHIGLARDDALRCHGNGLQARRAETVDGDARGGDGQTSLQRNLAGDVAARGTLRRGATHDDVVHVGAVDACTQHSVLHGVATQRGAVGHVERALPAFGKRRTGGGNNHCGCHVNSFIR